MHPQKPIAIALAGMLCLAVAMGIGRFAFTPLLPMMLHDGVVDLSGASWLATANYIGYWLGAMACALQPWAWSRWPALKPIVHTTAMRLGLAATVLLTAGMALHWPVLWALWRFLAGVASAVVFVYTSGWCLARLSAVGAPKLAGVIYVGPGLGIAVSGLAATAMVAGGLTAAQGWIASAVLALVLTAWVWPQLRGTVAATAPTSATAGSGGSAMAVLALAYGMAGFGYIVTATFLPVIARQTLPDSVWLDLFWPLFGVGVGVGALLTIRFPVHWDRRLLLMGCYTLQAAGCRHPAGRVVAQPGRLCTGQPADRSAVHRYHAVCDARGAAPAPRGCLGFYRTADGRLRVGPDRRPAVGGPVARAQRKPRPGLCLVAADGGGQPAAGGGLVRLAGAAPPA